MVISCLISNHLSVSQLSSNYGHGSDQIGNFTILEYIEYYCSQLFSDLVIYILYHTSLVVMELLNEAVWNNLLIENGMKDLW